MTEKEFLDRQYYVSFHAGMNQRYHQERARAWTWRDRLSKIIVGFLATVGVCLSVVTATAEHWGWDAAAISVGALAAIAAIALSVLPFGEWASQHTALFQRWTDLREDAEGLLFDFSEATPELIGRLKSLDARFHRICGTEPGCDHALLKKCEDAETRSRRPAIAGSQERQNVLA